MSRKLVGAALCALSLITLPSPVSADPSPSPPARELTLNQALALFQRQSPRVKALQSRQKIVESEAIEAGLYPNPNLSYNALALAHGVNTGTTWQHQIVIEQPVLLFGQRRHKSAAASAEIAAERADAQAESARYLMAIQQIFFSLLSHQERLKIHKETTSELKRLEAIIEARLRAGDESNYDLLRLQIETTNEELELDQARTNVEDSSRQLASALSIDAWVPRAKGTLEPRFDSTPLEQLWKRAQKQHPDIRAAQAKLTASQKQLSAVELDTRPVPSLALGALLTQGDYSSSVYFGVSSPLPLFDRGQGKRAKAQAQTSYEANHLSAELAEAKAHLVRLHTNYRLKLRQFKRVEAQLVKQIPNMKRMAERSYQAGSSDILALIDIFRTIKSIQLDHIEYREALKLLESELQYISGAAPTVGND